MNRFLDDVATSYDRIKIQKDRMNEHNVDELSFLRLERVKIIIFRLWPLNASRDRTTKLWSAKGWDSNQKKMKKKILALALMEVNMVLALAWYRTTLLKSPCPLLLQSLKEDTVLPPKNWNLWVPSDLLKNIITTIQVLFVPDIKTYLMSTR